VNAVPAIVEAHDRMPFREALAEALRERYTRRSKLVPCRWFEWNLRQRQAADALRAAGIAVGPAPLAPASPRCVQIVRLPLD
jgi:hypothetical protein